MVMEETGARRGTEIQHGGDNGHIVQYPGKAFDSKASGEYGAGRDCSPAHACRIAPRDISAYITLLQRVYADIVNGKADNWKSSSLTCHAIRNALTLRLVF